jgi:hypothetical protein
MVACLREEVSLVKLLLETGASLDCRNPGIKDMGQPRLQKSRYR